MDKNQPYFDPYNFNMQNNQAHIQSDAMPGMDNVNPAMYYEQQYMYYKYLTQVLDYKTKLRDFEKTNRESK